MASWGIIMAFSNDKKTFLAKSDKSRKSSIDERILSLVESINSQDDYYTTSSCSGRVYFWRGSGKKNEMEWLKVSHDLIDNDFFDLNESFPGLVWLRLEPFILHVCCQNLECASVLLAKAKIFHKKSCLLSASNKFLVEIRGSEFLEMPFFLDGKLLFSGEKGWLKERINFKLRKIWKETNLLEESLK